MSASPVTVLVRYARNHHRFARLAASVGEGEAALEHFESYRRFMRAARDIKRADAERDHGLVVVAGKPFLLG